MYKIKLSKTELNKFNSIENVKVRKKLMSIYSYLIKKSTDNIIKISFSKFLKMYTCYHYKMSLTSLKKYFKDLIDLKLLKVIENVKKTNVYEVIRYIDDDTASKKPTKEMTNQKHSTSIETHDIEENSKSYKYDNIHIKDLDSNSTHYNIETADTFDYDGYIKKENKVNNIDLVINKAHKFFKYLKVKSDYIKSKVISKLVKYADKITFKHVDSYVCTVIDNVRKDYYKNYNKYVLNNSNKQNTNSTFNNFKQRNYDFNKLEKQLLGW